MTLEHEVENTFRVALGMNPDETLHEWMIRHQAEINRLREQAVAEEREACAKEAERQDVAATDYVVSMDT